MRLKLNFIPKNWKNRFLRHPWGLRGKVRTSFIARWKARGRLSIHRNWTFFASSYGWDVIRGNLSKSAFFEGGWATFGEYLTGKGASPTNECWCQKTKVIAVSCGTKISVVHHLVLPQYTRLSDGRTYRQNCESNTVRYITCSRTVKTKIIVTYRIQKNDNDRIV